MHISIFMSLYKETGPLKHFDSEGLFYFALILQLTTRKLQALLRDAIFAQKSLTARGVQFYGEEEMKMQQTLRQVCAQLELSRRVIQGYENAGLVAPSGRNKYGHLLYDETEVEQIRLIRFYQQLGFQLKEIKSLLDAPTCEKKTALQIQIEKLERQHSQLHEIIQQAKTYIAAL